MLDVIAETIELWELMMIWSSCQLIQII